MKKQRLSALISLLGVGAGLYWAFFLRNTDSFYIVYLAVALVGLLAWFRNRKKTFSGWEKGWAGVFAFVLSFCVLLANGTLLDPYGQTLRPANRYYWLIGAVLLLGGFFLFRHILLLAVSHSQKSTGVPRKSGKVGLLCWASLAVVYSLVLYTAYYPGVLTYDSIYQLQQILGLTGYTNHHPYFYTRFIGLLYRLGMALFGDRNAAVALYSQVSILIMSGCFAYSVASIYRFTSKKGWTAAAWVSFLLLPYHILYSFAMWKDVFFAASVLLLTVSFYRCTRKDGTGWDLGVFTLSAFLMCMTRSNGRIALALCVPVALLLFFRSRKKLCGLLCAALVAGFFLNGSVLSWLNVPQPRMTESLSIPLQQVARVITDGCPLTEEEETLISQVVDISQVPENYRSYISDPIKAICDTAAIEENPVSYAKLYLGLLRKYPLKMLQGWVDQTKGYWNGGYPYWHFPAPYENDLGLRTTPPSETAHNLFTAYERLFESCPPLQLTLSIGLGSWLLLLCLYVGIAQKKRARIFLPLPLLAVIATLLIATPVYAEFRYAYSVFCTLPFLLAMTFGESK